MRFLDLYIKGFGKFHDTFVSFEDGLNLVYGKNEAGKSTIHTFIRGMLFGIERQRGRAAKNDLYSKYEPWENSSTYEGQLRLESGGTIYRFERSFQKNKKEFIIVNETTGREAEPTKALLDEILCGLSETAYNNTISIGQLKSATEGGMISELKNYIANMNTSGNMALNITKATAYLKNQKRQFENQLTPEAAKTYTSLLGEIKNLEREISSPEYENQLRSYAKERTDLKSAIEKKQEEREELLCRIEKGRQALAEFEFTDAQSVSAYLNHAEDIYRQYLEAGQAASKKSRRGLSVFFGLLGLLLLLGAGYFFCWGLMPGNSFLPWMPETIDPLLSGAAAAGASAVSFFAGALFRLKLRQEKKTAALCASNLSEIFRRHLGDGTISEKAMDALRNRMDDFIDLCSMIVRSEETVRRQMDDVEQLQGRQNQCSEIIEQQQRVQWELEKKLEHLAELKDQASALRQIIAENDRIREEIASIELAQETMKELSMSIRDSFGLYLNKTASELISGITGGLYTSMSIDENLGAFLNTRRKLIPLEQVSSGTADQIYLALRLAAARFIQNGTDSMPLIFDDSFVLYDDDRLRQALRWLSEAYKGQIIIFTCHRRELDILKEEEIKHHVVKI
ncbi:AAA family ATPase [Clostridiaceae bacterium Marseille-Q3526]|nr:AAA family ATPase [Clostridiaceae bacterium Marseille-Q3526]